MTSSEATTSLINNADYNVSRLSTVSHPYASVTLFEPTTHHYPPPPSFSSSSATHGCENPEKLREKIRETYIILSKLLKRLAALLLGLVLVLAISMVVITEYYPQTRSYIMPWRHSSSDDFHASSSEILLGEEGSDSSVSSESPPRREGVETCVSISEYMRRRCRDGSSSSSSSLSSSSLSSSGSSSSSATFGEEGCHWNVETALCLLIKTKTDLDERTKRLDEEVYEHNRQLENLFLRGGNKNVSAVYDRRPSAHFYLYYSHEYQGHKYENTFEPLLWNQWQSGLSSVREIDVTSDGNAIVNIRIRRPGYYHVYSQVTFNTSKSRAELNWTNSRPLHCLYKNYCKVRRPSCKTSAILRSYRLVGSSAVSYVQGVFGLRANDTLTVLAPSHLIDSSNEEGTFFGAFLI